MIALPFFISMNVALLSLSIYLYLHILWQSDYLITVLSKVGQSKPPPVLTSGFNRLKPPRSICQKVVNTGQYESEWSIENSKGRFCGGLRYLHKFYVLSIEKRKKILPRALFMVRFHLKTLALSSALQSMHLTLVFLASSKAE